MPIHVCRWKGPPNRTIRYLNCSWPGPPNRFILYLTFLGAGHLTDWLSSLLLLSSVPAAFRRPQKTPVLDFHVIVPGLKWIELKQNKLKLKYVLHELNDFVISCTKLNNQNLSTNDIDVNWVGIIINFHSCAFVLNKLCFHSGNWKSTHLQSILPSSILPTHPSCQAQSCHRNMLFCIKCKIHFNKK